MSFGEAIAWDFELQARQRVTIKSRKIGALPNENTLGI
jgi:hypothetical protein